MTTLWQIFPDQAAADAYTQAEARENLPLLPSDVTRRLADPMQLVDGRWVVQCFDGDGQPWQSGWTLPTPPSY